MGCRSLLPTTRVASPRKLVAVGHGAWPTATYAMGSPRYHKEGSSVSSGDWGDKRGTEVRGQRKPSPPEGRNRAASAASWRPLPSECPTQPQSHRPSGTGHSRLRPSPGWGPDRSEQGSQVRVDVLRVAGSMPVGWITGTLGVRFDDGPQFGDSRLLNFECGPPGRSRRSDPGLGSTSAFAELMSEGFYPGVTFTPPGLQSLPSARARVAKAHISVSWADGSRRSGAPIDTPMRQLGPRGHRAPRGSSS